MKLNQWQNGMNCSLFKRMGCEKYENIVYLKVC